MEKLLSGINNTSIGAILKQAGMEFNNAAVSTFGVFYATAFMEAGKEAEGKSQINPQDLKAMFKAACFGIKRRGGAKVGDKTMLDALVPVTEGVKRELRTTVLFTKLLRLRRKLPKMEQKTQKV